MKILLVALVAIALGGAAAGAPAQTVQKHTLTLEGAKQAVAAAVEYARGAKAPGGVIAVVDDGGNLMLLERLDGTFAAGANISIGKARTAVMFKRPTRVFEEIIRNGRTPMVALNDFTPLQGGVPIEVGGEIVGGIGVSGAASAQQDEELALAGAAALAGGKVTKPTGSTGSTGSTSASASSRSGEMSSDASEGARFTAAAAPAAPAPPVNSTRVQSTEVTFFDARRVAAAFDKGMPLLEVEGYKVHASRRDGAGMAEVHVKDTDIIYVLEGSATLVTGGTVVDPKTVAPDEIRGASIADGAEQQLRKGDVMIVPKGVPHWFRDVKGPLKYYVVKVG